MPISPRNFFSNLLNPPQPKDALIPLYQKIIEQGRNPYWYTKGGVKDTQDGRFDMIIAILSIILLRLENDEEMIENSVFLTELFVDDMDGQMRELGMGDVVVGKHVGKMVGALGGRLDAYRKAYNDGDLNAALIRNLYRDEAPTKDQLDVVRNGLISIYEQVQAMDCVNIINAEVHW